MTNNVDFISRPILAGCTHQISCNNLFVFYDLSSIYPEVSWEEVKKRANNHVVFGEDLLSTSFIDSQYINIQYSI